MTTVILWLLLSVVFFAVGEYLSKTWALNPNVKTASALVMMYILGTLAWLPAIYKGQSLSVVGTIWNLLSLMTTVFIGVVLFKETVTTTQMIGLGLAVSAIILLSL